MNESVLKAAPHDEERRAGAPIVFWTTDCIIAREKRMKNRWNDSAAATLRAGEWLLLAALTVGAVLVHGYHGGAEDAEIYLPGVLKQLNPALFPMEHPILRFPRRHVAVLPAGCRIRPGSRTFPLISSLAVARGDHLRTAVRVLPHRAVVLPREACGLVRSGSGGVTANAAGRRHRPLHHGPVRHLAIVFHRGFHAGAGQPCWRSGGWRRRSGRPSRLRCIL